jgi:hypothetical protein
MTKQLLIRKATGMDSSIKDPETAELNSSDSNETIESSDEEVDELLGIPSPLTSKRMRQAAVEIFEESGFKEDELLSKEQFETFLDKNVILKDVFRR